MHGRSRRKSIMIGLRLVPQARSPPDGIRTARRRESAPFEPGPVPNRVVQGGVQPKCGFRDVTAAGCETASRPYCEALKPIGDLLLRQKDRVVALPDQ